MENYYKDLYEKTRTEMYHAYRKIGCRDSRIRLLAEALKRIRNRHDDAAMVKAIADLWIETIVTWESEDVE